MKQLLIYGLRLGAEGGGADHWTEDRIAADAEVRT